MTSRNQAALPASKRSALKKKSAGREKRGFWSRTAGKDEDCRHRERNLQSGRRERTFEGESTRRDTWRMDGGADTEADSPRRLGGLPGSASLPASSRAPGRSFQAPDENPQPFWVVKVVTAMK